jgi:uncharacterized membrane protein
MSVARRSDITTPRRTARIGVHYDPDAFGVFSEQVARFIGTARFLVFQTVFCTAWVTWNIAAPRDLRFDEGPFIGLTLLLSLQAAYAAPLILLAQNRQEDRDRAEAESDRDLNARTQADTEFLAREVSSIRLGLSDVVTNDDLAEHLDRTTERLATHLGNRLEDRLDEIERRLAKDHGPSAD